VIFRGREEMLLHIFGGIHQVSLADTG
jgi:hypothetical protein